MGTWQERVRKAFGVREAQDLQRVNDDQARKDVALEEEREAREKRRRDLEKIRRIFGQLDSVGLLKRVRDDIWGEGKIIPVGQTETSLFAALEVEYRGGYSEGGSSDYSYVPRSYRGIWRDRLSIEVTVSNIAISDAHEFKEEHS